MDKKIKKLSLLVLIPSFLLTFFVNSEPTTEALLLQQTSNSETVQENTSEQETNEAEPEAAEQSNEPESTLTSVTPYKMYVTDQLFVFVHSGSSNRYRIIGRIPASEQVEVIAKDQDSGWLQVNYENTKTGWVDSSMITSNSGTKGELEQAQQQITELEAKIKKLDTQPDIDIDQVNAQITNLRNKNNELLNQIEIVNSEKARLQASIKEVDETRKILDKLYDVGVILIGIFVGWLLSRRKRSGISFNHL